jgi:hypothetical protein
MLKLVKHRDNFTFTWFIEEEKQKKRQTQKNACP